MAKATGEYTCDYCTQVFKWEAILRQKLPELKGSIDVESISKDAVYSTVLYTKDKTIVFIKCRCPKCDKLLQFEHNLQ
ncbi:MAG: hypothetical protein FWD71_15800 [Oscillospiraceae bacterium]|nr:hypothetical protein [Oscillospiraceae bacterium]